YLEDCQSLLTPIRRLPSEILVEIFQLCWILQRAMTTLAHGPILTLSQVCIRWHSVALGTPSLWNDIVLNGVLWATPECFDLAMRVLRFALERSANHPLDLTV
ncbi:hypothetical protein C8R46DRAFT_808430, partial [Mycena filopes]